MGTDENNGWNEWRKLVLSKLDDHTKAIESLATQQAQTTHEVYAFKAALDNVHVNCPAKEDLGAAIGTMHDKIGTVEANVAKLEHKTNWAAGLISSGNAALAAFLIWWTRK